MIANGTASFMGWQYSIRNYYYSACVNSNTSIWVNWKINSTTYYTNNPKLFSVGGNTTVWCYFGSLPASAYKVARYKFSPSRPWKNEAITFVSYSSSSESITDHSWNFGDGNTTSSGVTSTIIQRARPTFPRLRHPLPVSKESSYSKSSEPNFWAN